LKSLGDTNITAENYALAEESLNELESNIAQLPENMTKHYLQPQIYYKYSILK